MAKIVLNSTPAKASEGGGLSVIYDLTGKPDPFPLRVVDVKTTAEAMAALEVYKAEAAATGLPMVCTIKMKDGERALNGFKAATAERYFHPVNLTVPLYSER